jgi:dephospho-CoA kinase
MQNKKSFPAKNLISLNEYFSIAESINDKNLLKFIFVVGGAGSGKSFIAKNMFPDGRCKFYNTDVLLEYYATAEKFSLDFDNATPEEKKIIKSYTDLSKELYSRKSYYWLNGMLPIISDGTGMKSNYIIDLKNKYEDLGYDCYMIFVNTSKETSVERNKKRVEDETNGKRKANDWFAEDSWDAAQLNLVHVYHKVFGGNREIHDILDEIDAKIHHEDSYKELNPLTQSDVFNLNAKLIRDNKLYIINNNVDNIEKTVLDKLAGLGDSILNLPLENKKGLQLIADLKKIGGKYRTDLLDNKYARDFKEIKM